MLDLVSPATSFRFVDPIARRVRNRPSARPNYRPLGKNDFRELPEHELAKRPDEELIEYLRAARTAGNERALRAALAVLVHGYLPIMERRAALKVPTWADAEDIAADAMESALKSAFDGESVGEFRNWINRILLRRIADFHRRREGKPELGPLLTGDEDDEKVWGEVLSVEFAGVPVDAHRALKVAWDELSEQHQHVVEQRIFADLTTAEVAEQTGESKANVDQIVSRFRKRVRELLNGSDTSD